MILDQVITRAQAFGERLRDSSEPEGFKWSDQKARCIDLAEHVLKVAPLYGHELLMCALRLEFRDHEDGKKSVKKWSSCNRRWCPVCAWRKSRMRYAAVLRNLPKIFDSNNGARYALWTFTVRNCHVSDLGDVVAAMSAGFRRMMLRKTSPVIGYVRALEITFPREGEAHPHYHVVVARGRYSEFPTADELREQWAECVGLDYVPMVNAQYVKARGGGLPAVLDALSQVLKYSIKPMNELPYATWAIPAIAAMKGVRFVATGGIFKELFAEDEDKPEKSAVIASRGYAWRSDEGEYRRELDV